MFDTIVVATDGSDSVGRAVSVAVDVAARFDAEVHAVYVVDAGEVESSPDTVREDLRDALDDQGRDALDRVSAAAHERDGDLDVTIEVREGRPASEIDAYARSVDADLVAMGTRGRHGENRFLIGSVAERVVRTCPIPVLTVRQLTEEDPRRTTV
ncbi:MULTISPECIES: universal stress protein [Halorubrum]|uniref:Universal stress protein UspA n=1 Tax=Halorubrum tropicale TaxID=1765655 RepID=A0A0M9AST7_9EURY|nr:MULTISPECIES: universal stress protein [Halorubrum]KOX98012.1 universal stress protein UspA [Halorubrum tropicale]TKX42420.1 universal stress protein [Halorubrum sp. ARQ200]TKX48839.1 universal stress protein [Halorubrum sp. ASP121]